MTIEAIIVSRGGSARDYRGRFLPKLRDTPEGSREWLIWSKYHRAWHRRSAAGGASGYTDDISQAGLFDRAMANAYNDDRDRPYHVSEKLAAISTAIVSHEQALARLRDHLKGKS